MYHISRELSLVQDISRLGENSISQALVEGKKYITYRKEKEIRKRLYIYMFIYMLYI